MRILLDLQGAQTIGSRHRGIGRYTRAFTKAVIRHAGDHEVFISLNGAFAESVAELRNEFAGLLPPENIQVWNPIGPVYFADEGNDQRREGAEMYREFIQSTIRPDMIHITSLFEGFGDDSVSTIGHVHCDIPTSVTLYDLIPLYYPDHYMANLRFKQWYDERLIQLGRADTILSISASSKSEADVHFNFHDAKVVNVGTDADPEFTAAKLKDKELKAFRDRYGLKRPFVLYAGGIDFRKNNERLIESFAALPKSVRDKYQLAVVCSILPADRDKLAALAKDKGLGKDDLVMTGYVPEDDLIKFYSLCELLIFPSFHEGFGLPVLEAMRCGAPVIVSNRSSLPEIVGMADAMFDPYDVASIAGTMRRALTDAAFMKKLRKNSASQAQKFSWDEIGKRAWRAFEATERAARSKTVSAPLRRRLAMVSPMPPAKSGIADYVAELIPELSAFYEIDVVVADAQRVLESEAVTGVKRVITAEQFRETYRSYDRIVYQFGNSDHHEHMFDLLKVTRGIVVLHDFYISGIVAHREWHGGVRENWWEELYYSHGYAASLFRAEVEPESEAVWRYPCSKSVLDNADQVIVHSMFSKSLAKQWFGQGVADAMEVIPHLRARPGVSISRAEARAALDLDDRKFVVCAFGHLGPSKLNLELVKAWELCGLAHDPDCELIFVGQLDEGAYKDELTSVLEQQGSVTNVSITGWTDLPTFRAYLAAADVGVQLRALSRGETSGTVLDCLNYGLPLIANASGSMAELSADAVTLLPEEVTIADLSDALLKLRRQPALREKKSRLGKDLIRGRHDPRDCARQYRDVIERGYAGVEKHQRFLSNLGVLDAGRDYNLSIAERLDREQRAAKPRLVIDVTHLAQSDARTGIQRVVRNILANLIRMEDVDYRVEPCFFDEEIGRYRYARTFMRDFLDIKIGGLQDEVVDFKAGDTLLGLDLNPIGSKLAAGHINEIRSSGVRIVFVVYDILPIKIPECFPPEAETYHRDWLSVVMNADEALCISESVANDLRDYARDFYPENRLRIESFPLGSDLGIAAASGEVDPDVEFPFGAEPTLLMVGTIEPRKGHALVLDALELLWAQGRQVNLLFIGKQGWMVEKLVERMNNLAAKEPRFRWMDQASDAFLEYAYRRSTCLIAASIDEGYGLPLLEAEAHGLPVIARNIPVFREVGGAGVTYFDAKTGRELSAEIKEWLAGHPSTSHAEVRRVPITWDDSTRILLDLLADAPVGTNA